MTGKSLEQIFAEPPDVLKNDLLALGRLAMQQTGQIWDRAKLTHLKSHFSENPPCLKDNIGRPVQLGRPVDYHVCLKFLCFSKTVWEAESH